jgi:hypothetical protein
MWRPVDHTDGQDLGEFSNLDKSKESGRRKQEYSVLCASARIVAPPLTLLSSFHVTFAARF